MYRAEVLARYKYVGSCLESHDHTKNIDLYHGYVLEKPCDNLWENDKIVHVSMAKISTKVAVGKLQDRFFTG